MLNFNVFFVSTGLNFYSLHVGSKFFMVAFIKQGSDLDFFKFLSEFTIVLIWGLILFNLFTRKTFCFVISRILFFLFCKLVGLWRSRVESILILNSFEITWSTFYPLALTVASPWEIWFLSSDCLICFFISFRLSKIANASNTA